MASRYLYLVRHGQYNAAQPTSHPLEGNLTKLGQHQAAKTARYLKNLPITAIHLSDLQRTVETAEPICSFFPQIKAHKTKRLRECVPYVSPQTQEFFKHIPTKQIEADREQAEKAYAYYFRPTKGQDRHEILVSHGNLIRYFACRAIGADPALWLNLESRNCGITRFSINADGEVVLISYNDISHLPPNLHTDNMYL